MKAYINKETLLGVIPKKLNYIGIIVFIINIITIYFVSLLLFFNFEESIFNKIYYIFSSK